LDANLFPKSLLGPATLVTDKAEAIIVGGGVIGTCIAFHLAKLGMRDLLLLERSHLAAGSTGRSVGMVETVYSSDVNVALAKFGYEELSRFEAVTGHSADFHPRKYLETVRTPEHVHFLEEAQEISARYGLDTAMLTPEEVREVFPELRTEDLAAGLLSDHAGFCDPHSVATGYAEAAKSMGLRIRTRSPVERVLVDHGQVRGVRVGGEELATPVVVNATGAWCNDLNRGLGFELPVELWQRQIFVTTPHAEIPADRPMYIDTEGRFYFRQELDGGFILGLVEDTAAKDLANPETDWDFKTKAVEAAVHRVPMLADTQIARGWSGIVTFTPDQLPVLGAVREAQGFYLANGMSGYGVMISPAVGQILAEMIVRGESRTIDASSLSYDRFREGGPAKASGLWLVRG
jgi:sarcosine oxidase subunit beta